MMFKSSNEYTVHFKDGTSFDSRGSSSGINKSQIKTEFEWTAFHINKELVSMDKTLEDVKSIEYKLNYSDKPSNT